jgi:hypothetical protein
MVSSALARSAESSRHSSFVGRPQGDPEHGKLKFASVDGSSIAERDSVLRPSNCAAAPRPQITCWRPLLDAPSPNVSGQKLSPVAESMTPRHGCAAQICLGMRPDLHASNPVASVQRPGTLWPKAHRRSRASRRDRRRAMGVVRIGLAAMTAPEKCDRCCIGAPAAELGLNPGDGDVR